MYKFLPNYSEHPTKSNYMIFTFRDKEMVDYFESELKRRKIKYETDEEEVRGSTMYFFGVLKSDKNEVYQLNLLTIGKFRKPFFRNKYLRITLVIILIALVTLAVLGYIKQ